MDVMIAKLREEDVPGYDRLLAGRGPSGQSKQRAPVTFVNDAVADQIVILTMIEHRHADHARILYRPSHQLVVLHAMTIIGDRYDPALRERADGCQLFAGQIF